MKNLLILTLSIFLITSCNKENQVSESNAPENKPYDTLFATMNGSGNENFVATAYLLQYRDSTGDELNIYSYKEGTDEIIYLRIYPFIQEGKEYTFNEVDQPLSKVTFAEYKAKGDSVFAKDGSVTIDSIKFNYLKGRYHFTTSNNIHIEGSFGFKKMYYVAISP